MEGGRVYVFSLLGLVGRLGNQLWQIAATMDHAERDPGSRAAVPSDWEYRDFVGLPEEFYDPPQPGEEIVDVARLPEGPYYQWLGAIERIAPQLRVLFGPSLHGQGRLREHHGTALQAATDTPRRHLTAMHIRRTDYLDHPDRFPQMTSAYWHQATKTVLSEHPDTTFRVFSDDIPWCRQNTDFLGITERPHEFIEGHVRPVPPRERIGEPLDILDLWLMSQSDAHIICNSTFSWWGAFLSEQKLVIYPNVWFGADAQHSDKMWQAFPESWRQMPC